jgi:hypothetical protein
MLIVSISSTSTNATLQLAAFSLISFASSSRDAESSFFESSMPMILVPGFRTTAAAATRPASGLIPASSTPCDGMVAAVPEKCFEANHLTKTLSFGAVFEAPLFDKSQDGASSRAAVSAQVPFNARFKGSILDNTALTEFIERISSHVAGLSLRLAFAGISEACGKWLKYPPAPASGRAFSGAIRRPEHLVFAGPAHMSRA